MSDPLSTVAVLVLLVCAAAWAIRAEIAHRRHRVTGLLGAVRALAATDLAAARHLHGQAARVARLLPRDALADTDQWLLEVGAHAAIPAPTPDVEPRYRFVVRPRPLPDPLPPRADGLDLIGTTRIPRVTTGLPPPARGGADGRGRAAGSAGEAGSTPGRGHPPDVRASRPESNRTTPRRYP